VGVDDDREQRRVDRETARRLGVDEAAVRDARYYPPPVFQMSWGLIVCAGLIALSVGLLAVWLL
jgi:hypothetical protein